MKRSAALTPLSREHHQALFLVKQVRDRQGEGESRELILAFWEAEGAAHFRIEEEVLLPGSGLDGPDRDPEVARMLDDHLAIRRGINDLREERTSPEGLIQLVDRLHDHVRFEERELFPRIERDLPECQLEDLRVAILEAEAEIGSPDGSL